MSNAVFGLSLAQSMPCCMCICTNFKPDFIQSGLVGFVSYWGYGWMLVACWRRHNAVTSPVTGTSAVAEVLLS